MLYCLYRNRFISLSRVTLDLCCKLDNTHTHTQTVHKSTQCYTIVTPSPLRHFWCFSFSRQFNLCVQKYLRTYIVLVHNYSWSTRHFVLICPLTSSIVVVDRSTSLKWISFKTIRLARLEWTIPFASSSSSSFFWSTTRCKCCFMLSIFYCVCCCCCRRRHRCCCSCPCYCPLSLQTLSTVGGWIISGNGRIWNDNDNIQLRIWLQSHNTT